MVKQLKLCALSALYGACVRLVTLNVLRLGIYLVMVLCEVDILSIY